jgi:hypothetical protein
MSRPSFLEKEGQVNNSTIVRVFMTLRGRLQDPAVLVIIAVVFLISAVGQAILQLWLVTTQSWSPQC